MTNDAKPISSESLSLALKISHIGDKVCNFITSDEILNHFRNQEDKENIGYDSLSIQNVALVSKNWHLGPTVIMPKGKFSK
jgi:hypothetical protein